MHCGESPRTSGHVGSLCAYAENMAVCVIRLFHVWAQDTVDGVRNQMGREGICQAPVCL